MGKRLTKAQREEMQKNALWQRVADVMSGAAGQDMSSEDAFMGPEELSRAVPALREIFGEKDDDGNLKKEWLWDAGSMHRYIDSYEATEFLFRNGVRA